VDETYETAVLIAEQLAHQPMADRHRLDVATLSKDEYGIYQRRYVSAAK
jgi:hypothetical protein